MRKTVLVAAMLLLVASPCFGGLDLVKYMTTKPAPSMSSCPPNPYPTPVSSFATTDPAVYLWFQVSGARLNDVFSAEYYTPSGSLYAPSSGAWDPVDTPGDYCFADMVPIAGAAPASLTGTWSVVVKYNAGVLFILKFDIGGATPACTYAISPATATVSASGGSGTASLTTQSGCTWSATSNAAWIATSSSGSGSGTIGYTVAANTAATARSGTITAGGQSLTITQSAASAGGGGTLTGNLLQNPGAEAGPAGGVAGLPSIPGWTTDGNVGVVAYTDPGGQLDANGPGPPNRGSNYFDGGYSGVAKMSQTLDLSSYASAIDAGSQPYTLDGWLGGWDGQDDNATLTVTFQNASGTTLGTATIGPVLSADRNGVNSLLERTKTGTVPAGTRKAVVTAQFNRVEGSANDGAADNLYFGLTGSAGGGGSSGGTLNLTINQVIDTACPSDKIIVSVTDSTGRAITGLTSANFTLKEAGVSRTVSVVPVGSGSSSGALSLAIMIDTSSSLSSTDLANEKSAAKQLVSQMGATDQVAVYAFETSVRLVQDFTSDKTRLNSAIDGITGGSSTALYKAVQTAAQALGARSGRKSIVLMTDGEDTVGGATIDQAIAAAKTAGAPVFPVGYGSANSTILTRIANETGGFYSSGATSADLQKILQSLGQVMSSQYEVSFTSGAPTTDNTVEITVTYNGQTATASRTVSKCSNSGGGGTGSSCTYFLQPQSLSVPASGASGTIIVSTQAGCAVNASASTAWIHIVGSSTGAVSWQVDANSGGARSGTITIGNRTVPVNQDGAVSCGYSMTPSSNSVSPLGATSSFRLNTSPGCPWSATVNASATWFHYKGPASGTGPANLTYTVDANTTVSARSATVAIANLTFTLNQGGGASPTAPTIAPGGIVNAASNRAGTIARGSFFTIYGTNLGPSAYQQVQGYPIPDTMGGVVVTVSQGNYNKRAYLHFVSAPQINAILPSDVPLGDVQITVTYNGNISSTATVTVANTAFGVFSTASGPGPGIVQNFNSASDQPLNLASYPLKPKQIAILWGTGLGPIQTGDNNPPPGGDLSVPVSVLVGGKPANKLYSGRAPSFAGVDNIYFEVPADAPAGCSVPVQITAGGVVSNTVRVAVSGDGSKCQDTANPFGNTTAAGAKQGTLGLARITFSGTLDSSKGPVNGTFDVGFGSFSDTPAGGELAYSPFMNLPPAGTCVSTSKSVDLGSVIGSSGLSLDNTNSKSLDAGASLSVTGPKGTVKVQHFDPNASSGPYLDLIGGNVPVDGSANLPLFLDGGAYTIAGSGGKDVGAFSAAITLGTPLTWTNQSQINTVSRSQDLTLTWSGGDSGSNIVILGGSSDQKTKKTGGFFCLAPANATSFTIPANILQDLPPTGSAIGSSDSLSMIAIGALPMSTPPSFTAPGLTSGRIFTTSVAAKSVTVQ
ncbi:MAG: VWA domain-containing protein [Acidobacteria bacterium]|nr:VWA domain-containing protein [Acidobacteriota bacterium]